MTADEQARAPPPLPPRDAGEPRGSARGDPAAPRRPRRHRPGLQRRQGDLGRHPSAPGGAGRSTCTPAMSATPTHAPPTITDQLPAGLTIVDIDWHDWKDLGVNASEHGPRLLHRDRHRHALLHAAYRRGRTCWRRPPAQAAPGAEVRRRATALPDGYMPPVYLDVRSTQVLRAPPPTRRRSPVAAPPTVHRHRPVPFGSTPSTFGIVPGSYSADFFNAAYPFGSPCAKPATTPSSTASTSTSTAHRVDNGLPATLTPLNGRGSTRRIHPAAWHDRQPRGDPQVRSSRLRQPGRSNSPGCPADTQVGYLNV